MQKIIFEVCANSISSAQAAQQGGADRIELCAKLEIGGVTPPFEVIGRTLLRLSIPVYILIRPRGGDFVYDDNEFCLMKKEILYAKEIGAAGIVAGILTPKGDIDVVRTTELVSLAAPMQFTFHRAFDRARDPLTALEDVIKTGADRILTSGQAKSAWEGRALLQILRSKASSRITLLAGAGINPTNLTEIIKFTGITEVHASCSVKLESNAVLTSPLDDPSNPTITDVDTVKQIVSLIKNHKI